MYEHLGWHVVTVSGSCIDMMIDSGRNIHTLYLPMSVVHHLLLHRLMFLLDVMCYVPRYEPAFRDIHIVPAHTLHDRSIYPSRIIILARTTYPGTVDLHVLIPKFHG